VTSMRGLILFAHGARDPNWALPFEQTAARVREMQPEARVELAFLEFMTPDLASSGDRLAHEGCAEIEVLPLFLGSGGHVRRDLPALVERLRQRWPEVRWSLRAAVGESPALIEAMAAIAAARQGAA
jgi:sirohydrochlorin cobaltochelatase